MKCDLYISRKKIHLHSKNKKILFHLLGFSYVFKLAIICKKKRELSIHTTEGHFKNHNLTSCNNFWVHIHKQKSSYQTLKRGNTYIS